MTDSQFEELLAEAIQEYGGDYIEVPEEMWKPHRFSRTFEKRMRRILWKERGIRPPRKRIPLRMLVAVIVTAIIAVSATALTVSAFREAIIGFIMDVYETFTNVRAETDEEEPETLEEIYEVTWVPEGFELMEDELAGYCHFMLYQDGENFIFFKQFSLSDYISNYDTENAEIQEVKIGSIDGLWITGEDIMILVWRSDDYAYEIFVEHIQRVDENDVYKMAESVKKVDS